MAAIQVPPLTAIAAPSEREHRINVLLTTFAGLGLPRTLSLPVAPSTTVRDVVKIIYSRLAMVDHVLIITTTSNKQLLDCNHERITTLLSSEQDTFLPLRLSARLCGGKGGFGSQLRAAGGRMSSRKNRNQQNQNPNGSNRNLDGRRLRTVDEAKRLAEYLATKPDMDKKEKEERRKRWEQVVENAERRQEEIKSGKMGSGQGRLDAEYVESKEMAEEKTREAVLKAMREGTLEIERTGSESSMEVDEEESENDNEAGEGSTGSSDDAKVEATEKKQDSGPKYYGWDDDDDEDDSEDNEEADGSAPEAQGAYERKGKAKAT